MNVVIIGAGGHGKVVLDILRAQKKHSPVAFLDADPALAGTKLGGLPILGGINQLPKLRSKRVTGAIVAIGDNKARRDYAQTVRQNKLRLVNAIHPGACVSPTALLGENVVVAAGAAVCVDVKLGSSVIINTNAVVDHECDIGDAAHICPGALLAGRVRVGIECFVGLGATVIQCLTVGDRATIGAGAVVLQDVPEGSTVVGVPARMVRQ